MSLSIFLMVVLAAIFHATWNFLAKTVPGGPLFVWLVSVVGTLFLLPVTIWWIWTYGFNCTTPILVGLFFSSLLHVVYFLILQHGYKVADLSVVYPLARGSGPVFTAMAAVIFLGEHLTIWSMGGLVLVVIGVLLIAGLGQEVSDRTKLRLGVGYGILIGAFIAAYTVLDSYLVRSLAVAPLIVEYVSQPFRMLVLIPALNGRWSELKSIWKGHWLKIIAVGTLGPVGFIMILYAVQYAPVYVVAPTRELSIVFGVVLGAKFLTESHFWSRLTGAILILSGIITLAFGG